MKVYTFHTISTNNGRARAGLKKHRKLNKKKRFYTRNACAEAVSDFLDFLHQ